MTTGRSGTGEYPKPGTPLDLKKVSDPLDPIRHSLQTISTHVGQILSSVTTIDLRDSRHESEIQNIGIEIAWIKETLVSLSQSVEELKASRGK